MAEDFTFLGIPEFGAALNAWAERASIAARQATASGGHAIEAKVKRKLTTYSHPAGTPTPSPPGEPPALVTGQMRRSVRVSTPAQVAPGTWETRTGPSVIYGRIQELGGRAGRGSVLPARPYLAPSVAELLSSGELFRIMRDAWARAQG